MKNSKLNFKNNFYLIKWIFHDPISTKWLKGFQKYFAYKLPMVQGCTQTILVSIWKNYIFFKNFHCCKMRPDGALGSHCGGAQWAQPGLWAELQNFEIFNFLEDWHQIYLNTYIDHREFPCKKILKLFQPFLRNWQINTSILCNKKISKNFGVHIFHNSGK